MKIGKKTVMGISFIMGTLLFATTAFAEVSSKSGYEQAKDALKFTGDSLNSKLQNYTVNTSIIVKDNGNIISEKDYINKYDLYKNAIENSLTDSEGNKPKVMSYYYHDKNTIINESSSNNIYNVINYPKEVKFEVFENPFKGKQVDDVERIVDAAVGNLKDSVVVSQKDNGTKELSGNISESQIPAIANALVSYEVKSRYGVTTTSSNDNVNVGVFPKNMSDVYVKNVSGDMILNKDGLIISGLGSAEITCNDKEGKVHNLTFEIVGKVVDINTTKIDKPDLTGKKVNVSNTENDNKLSDPQSYVGTYKNDIVIKKEGKFEKIGERTVDLTSLDDKRIIGRYRAEYIKGYESYDLVGPKDVNFTANVKDIFNATFEIKDSNGKKIKGTMGVSPDSTTINFGFTNIQSQDNSFNSQFIRVFN